MTISPLSTVRGARPSAPCRSHTSRPNGRPVLRGVSHVLLVALVLAGPGLTGPALSAPCPGLNGVNQGAGRAYTQATMTPSRPLFAIIGTGCVSVPQGDVTNCNRLTFTTLVLFEARWPSAAAREADATGGCSFMCQNGDCFVDKVGLPVELMHFGVE